MTFSDHIDAVDPPFRTVTLLNRQTPDPLYGMVVDFFEPMGVAVREAELDAGEPSDAVLLHDGDDPIAVSSLSELYEGALGANADRYVTGTVGLDEMETPAVISELRDVRIPGEEANKFAMIQMSRHVEAMAHRTGAGELHAGFQRLSRLTGERGTREAYRRLAEVGVDVHAYGVGDRDAVDLPVTVHAEDAAEIRDYWFVIYDGAGSEGGAAALVAEEVDQNTYRGFWTFDADRVGELLAYVNGTYGD